MTVSPEDDFAAAEYALGTLDASERATLAARRLREPDLDEAILAWEARLAPLAEAVPEIEPPRDLLPAIEARIRGASPEAPGNGAIVELERSIRRWRAMAIAASLFAGVLAIGFVARETSRRSAPHEYVAILQKDAASPAFAVTVNLDRQELTVRPVAAQAPPGKSYELWLIDAKLGRALARRDWRQAAWREPVRVRSCGRRRRDLCRDGRTARRIADRPALRRPGLRGQAHSGHALGRASPGGFSAWNGRGRAGAKSLLELRKQLSGAPTLAAVSGL